MRYIGSKSSTLKTIGDLVRRRAPGATSICDPFAGTCTVARHFKRLGMRVTTGDVLALSHVIQWACIGLNRPPDFKALKASGRLQADFDPCPLRYLASVAPIHGYLTENFSPIGAHGRMFFTVENASRIDAMRATIADWKSNGLVSFDEEAYLLAALIVSADKVANTAGTYYAHLKAFDRKAVGSVDLVPLETIDNGRSNSCNLGDAVDVAANADADILYLDPPYNQRDYARYYHLPETMALGDAAETHGKSGVPRFRKSPSSLFCRAATATTAMENLLQVSNATHLIVHYTPNGLIPHEELLRMLRDRGRTTYEDVFVRKYSSESAKSPAATLNRIYWCDSFVS